MRWHIFFLTCKFFGPITCSDTPTLPSCQQSLKIGQEDDDEPFETEVQRQGGFGLVCDNPKGWIWLAVLSLNVVNRFEVVQTLWKIHIWNGYPFLTGIICGFGHFNGDATNDNHSMLRSTNKITRNPWKKTMNLAVKQLGSLWDTTRCNDHCSNTYLHHVKPI